jgi:RND superfamily putative drug exporter
VLADALLVRCLLLPASLRLLGPRAWWLPASLRRLHQRINHEERPEPEPCPEALPSND